MGDFILEQKIKETLAKKAEYARADIYTEQRIRANVYSKIKEAERMKNKNWKKTVVVTAAICILGSMTVLGLGKTVSIEGGSSHAEMINSYVAAEAKQESLDEQVKIIEKFSNGYVFKGAVPFYETARDKDGNVTGEETTLQVIYAKNGAKDIYASSGRLSTGLPENPDTVRVLEDGTELLFTSLVNKIVADDYVITDEEKVLQEAGKLNIAYDGRKGTEVDVMVSSHVIWKQNEITYSLMLMDDEMTAEEMLDMAQEIAESE